MVEQERRSTDSKVADYWDEHTDETYFGETYWLANPVINRHHQSKAAGGRDYESWVNFSVCNVETNPFPLSDYDAIYFNSSLHHMSDLDAILIKCCAALKQDGYLFVNEYIGPNRFTFSDREKEVMQSVFHLIPEKYRVSHAEHDRGQIRKQVHYPDPAEVERVDPSEAIHSEEIVDSLKRHFKIEEFNYTGGTLMQFMLLDIAGNFKESDAESMQILQLIFDIEDTLVASGGLLPHFAMIIARP